MKRLTTPAQERVLFAWFVRHHPPALLKVAEAVQLPDDLRIGVVEESVRADQTVLRIRIDGLPSVRGQTKTELLQTWERRGETWYFLPTPAAPHS